MDENNNPSTTFEDHIKDLEVQVETLRQFIDGAGPSHAKDLAEIAYGLAYKTISLSHRSKRVYALMSDQAEAKFKDQLEEMFSPPFAQTNPKTIPSVILALNDKISEKAQEDVRIEAVAFLSAVGVYKTCNGTRERIELIFGSKSDAALRNRLPTSGAVDVVTTFRTAVLAMTKLSEIARKG